jgi:acyl-CoA thioesterase-2
VRRGDAGIPTAVQVFRDRDGGSFSARRVVALQHGEVIFSMSASFHRDETLGPGSQDVQMPVVGPPENGRPHGLMGLRSFVGRLPAQPYDTPWPTRFWARTTMDLSGADPLQHACVLTYLSDISTGTSPSPDGTVFPSSSLDHAVWFHRPADMSGWTLSDFNPRASGHGRGLYTGEVFAPDGTLLASIAQECLFRARRPGAAELDRWSA